MKQQRARVVRLQLDKYFPKTNEKIIKMVKELGVAFEIRMTSGLGKCIVTVGKESFLILFAKDVRKCEQWICERIKEEVPVI